MFGGGIDTAEDELMAQALGADMCDDDDESGDDTADKDKEAPRDGVAYLRSVMREAKKEKQVVVAPNATALTAVRPRDDVYTGRQALIYNELSEVTFVFKGDCSDQSSVTLMEWHCGRFQFLLSRDV